jgi:hypothetical protein
MHGLSFGIQGKTGKNPSGNTTSFQYKAVSLFLQFLKLFVSLYIQFIVNSGNKMTKIFRNGTILRLPLFI